MSTSSLLVHVRVAWWFTPYLYALCFFCALKRKEPDWVKLARVIDRALKVEVTRR